MPMWFDPELYRNVGLECKDESLTVQSDSDRVSLDRILARFGRGGDLVDGVPVRQPMYGDFSEFPDYVTALNQVRDAQAMFEGLPALVRDRFANDPAKLIAFVSDPQNRDEAIKLGLVVPPVAPVKPEPMEVRVVSEPLVVK